jgi:ubiquitin fusion degradation protein 1
MPYPRPSSGAASRRTRRFNEYFRCYPIAALDRPELNYGGKIIMPPSALEKLTRLHIAYPMLFELHNGTKSRTTHAGVLEFIAEEGRVYLPYWMMQTLSLDHGDLLQIKSTDLPSGSFIKLQPQSTAFLTAISDPKAVLENVLRNFSALTKDDTFEFLYNDEVFAITILETKPAEAVSCVETDLEVDFAPPLDYVEPTPTATSSAGSSRPGERSWWWPRDTGHAGGGKHGEDDWVLLARLQHAYKIRVRRNGAKIEGFEDGNAGYFHSREPSTHATTHCC